MCGTTWRKMGYRKWPASLTGPKKMATIRGSGGQPHTMYRATTYVKAMHMTTWPRIYRVTSHHIEKANLSTLPHTPPLPVIFCTIMTTHNASPHDYHETLKCSGQFSRHSLHSLPEITSSRAQLSSIYHLHHQMHWQGVCHRARLTAGIRYWNATLR